MSSLKIFSGNSNPNLARDICNNIGVVLGKAVVDAYPDGETFVKINENIRGCDVFIIQSINQPANHHIMELLIIVDAVRRSFARRITAVMPFFGYARQDRQDQLRVPITAKLVANLLVTSGVDQVLTVDLHSQQIQGFFDVPVEHLHALPVFYKYILEMKNLDNIAVFAPDCGSIKTATSYAKMINCPLGFVAKRRLDAANVEALNLVGSVEGKNIILVDDMTETAGTLMAAAQIIMNHGAKDVIAIVTHGVINSIGYERLSSDKCCLKSIITTNTTPIVSNGVLIKILNVSQLIGNAINRMHYNY